MTPKNPHSITPSSDSDPNQLVVEEVSAIQTAVERVTQNYLETLEALSTVYEAATGFSQLFDSSSIAYFTLRRILESLDLDCGAIYLETGGMLQFQLDSENARDLLKEEGLDDASLEGRDLFCNGSEAIHYLRPDAGNRNVLLAPIVAAQRRLGIVVVLSDHRRPFTTKDLKLVGAVTSQAAISLSGAQHLEQIIIERQKLRSIIEDNGGGIVVLAPDGRTMLTNAVARELLELPADRAEGFLLVDELAHWKFSREPEILCGEGPTSLSLEMASGVGPDGRVVSVIGRRVRGTDGELANIVLTLQDATEKRRGEMLKEDLLALLSTAFQAPLEGLRECLAAAEEREADGDDGPQPHLERLLQLSTRLRGYVEILDDSWSGTGTADLEQVVVAARAKLLEEYRARAPRVELTLDSSAATTGVSAECARLVIENLLANAVEYGPDTSPEVRVSTFRRSPEWLVLSVEDRLDEHPADFQQRFINEFGPCRHDIPVELTGLAIRLALVREIVHRLGGQLEVRAMRGVGTQLTVTLPSSELS